MQQVTKRRRKVQSELVADGNEDDEYFSRTSLENLKRKVRK